MKYILIFLSFLFFSVSYAQDIKKKYVSRTTEEGSIYFIYPQKGFESKEISSKLEYDITYLSYKDSVTYNFTFFNKQASPVDSVRIEHTNLNLTVNAVMLFIEPHKDNWEQRVSIKIPKDEIKAMYKNSTPYQLRVFSEKKEFLFQIKKDDWEKQAAIINKIFEMIKYNKH